jgi:hypothetical protein
MLEVALSSFLTLVEALLPNIGVSSGSAALIDTIIAELIKLLPVVIQGAQALIGPIQNIIAALSANPATTADQLATLQALDKQCDTAFEAAATAAASS